MALETDKGQLTAALEQERRRVKALNEAVERARVEERERRGRRSAAPLVDKTPSTYLHRPNFNRTLFILFVCFFR